MKQKKQIISILLTFILVASLAGCNFSSSVNKTATVKDVEKYINYLDEIDPVHLEISSESSGDEESLEEYGNSLSLLMGVDFSSLEMITGEDTLDLSLDIDKQNNIAVGEVKTSYGSIKLIENEETTYIDVDYLINMFYESEYPEEVLDILNEILVGKNYLNLEIKSDLINSLGFDGLIDLAESGYFDMKFLSEKNSETGKSVTISIDLMDKGKESLIKEVGLDSNDIDIDDIDVSIKLIDIRDGEKFEVIFLTSIEGAVNELKYTYSKSTATIETPDKRETFTQDEVEQMLMDYQEAILNGEVDNPFGDDAEIDYDTGFTFDSDDTDGSDTDIENNISSDSKDKSIESGFEYDPDYSTIDTLRGYTSTFSTSESEISSTFKDLGEFEYTSDFRRKFKNTYDGLINSLKNNVGFTESTYGNESSDMTCSVALETDQPQQSFGIRSFIYGGTSISYEQIIDNKEMPTDTEIKQARDNLQMYTGIDLSESVLNDMLKLCESYRSPDNYFTIKIMDEENDIDIEVTRFSFQTEISAVRRLND